MNYIGTRDFLHIQEPTISSLGEKNQLDSERGPAFIPFPFPGHPSLTLRSKRFPVKQVPELVRVNTGCAQW